MKSNEDLANRYLRAAGIATIWVDLDDGRVAATDVATVYAPEGCAAYCCHRGDEFRLANSLSAWKLSYAGAIPLEIVLKLEDIAAAMSIGLTKHETAVDRALAVVEAINSEVESFGKTGHMRELNAAFKAAREADPTLRYTDYVYSNKVAMVEEIAQKVRRPGK